MSEQFKRFAKHIETYNLELQCAMDGYTDAKIVIIGEYPGEQEVAFNKPFVGGAGKMLFKWLRQVGITRNQCYLTNLVKRRTGPKSPVSKHEYDLWKEALDYELSFLENVKLIICLGDSVLSALTGYSGITQFRGSVYDIEYAKDHHSKLLVANNPAAVLRRPETELIFAMDMKKSERILNGQFKEPEIHTIINPSYDAAMKYMDEIQRGRMMFGGDIEVIGMETACLGFAKTETEAMCINFRDAKDNRFTIEEEYNLLRKSAEVHDDPYTTSVYQNGNFDSYFMGCKDHLTFAVNFDTLLAHHTLYPKLPHNLGFLTSQYTDHPYYKDEKDTFHEGGDIDGFWKYNGKDCCITLAAARCLKTELEEQGLYEFFTTHVMRMQPHLSYSTQAGVKVNQETKNRLVHELSDDLENRYEELQKVIRKVTNNPLANVNPSSPKQVSTLFFDVLNLKATKRSADADTRDQILADSRTSPDAKDIVIKMGEYIEERKFFSTYANSNLDADGRFRSEYKQFGVSSAPGRLSSGQTMWKSGGNAQNQPYRAYEMYVPDDGCVFIYFDLAQAEARYVAWDANIEHWIEDFERARLDGSFDAHRSLAATMFKKDYDDVAKDDIQDDQGRSPKHADFDPTTAHFTERYFAKRCRHGLNYRMHIARLAQTAKISYGLAAQNYYIYHRINPELQVWWNILEREVKKKQMLFNSLGRRFYITENLSNPKALDSIVAFRPQSTIGDKVQQVWYQCHEDPRWDMQKARIAINVHDALYGIATPAFAKTALSIMKAYAEKPITVTSIVTNKASQMIIPADMKISVPDKTGIHTMASMKDIDIEAARLFV